MAMMAEASFVSASTALAHAYNSAQHHLSDLGRHAPTADSEAGAVDARTNDATSEALIPTQRQQVLPPQVMEGSAERGPNQRPTIPQASDQGCNSFEVRAPTEDTQ